MESLRNIPWLWLYTAVEWGIRVVMTGIILHRRQKPATSLAWLTVIYLIPVLGVGAYLLIGVEFLAKRRKRGHQAVVAQNRPRQSSEAGDGATVDLDRFAAGQQSMIVQAQRLSGNPIVDGNALDLIQSWQTLIDRLIADIDAAEEHVHLLYYILTPDAMGEPVLEAVFRAADRGVTCRVLVDSAGSRPLFKTPWWDRLRNHPHIRAEAMLPVTPWRRKLARIDLRNHRKLAIVDGRIGYLGSHNLVIEWPKGGEANWIDLSGRVIGPVVTQLQLVFMDDWEFATGTHLDPDVCPHVEPAGGDSAIEGGIPAQAVPTGPSHEGESFRRVVVAAIHMARERIVITTPYLLPDEPTMLALSMAADRGVSVHIVAPRTSKQFIVQAAARAFYSRLLESGVHLHLFTDGMLHAKTITVDDAFAFLGSANMDIRSFELNFEVNVLLYGRRVTDQLRAVQARYMAQSQEVNAEAWQNRSVVKRYLENAAALLSPLL